MRQNRKYFTQTLISIQSVVFVFIGTINSLAVAQEALPQLVSESEYFAGIPSVDTVTRLPQPKSETPAAVTIIDREMIRASGARYLPDVFRLVPGFQVAYSRSEKPLVTYHGLGDVNARRMLVLIDGRSIHGSINSQVNWFNTNIALEDIERIEVIRGPNTVTYGDNAFLATINIITRHAVQTQGGTVKLTAGNHDIDDALLRYGSHFDSGDMRVTAGHLSEDGFDDKSDDIQTDFVNLRADLQLGTQDTLLLQLGLSQSDSAGGAVGSRLTPLTQRERLEHFEQLRWQHHFAEDNELNVQFYHNYHEADLDFLSEPINTGPLGFGIVQIPSTRDRIQKRYDLEFQHALRPWSNLRLVWGLGAREDSSKSEAFFNSNETLKNQSSRLFANTEWRVNPDTIINAGVLWEDNEVTGTDFSPRLAINYHLNNKHTLRAAWSQAQRIPSFGEEQVDQRITFMNVVIDQRSSNQYTLGPETMDSFELGYLGRFPAANLRLDMRVYRDQISDYITHTIVSVADVIDNQALAFRNEGDVTIDGIDLELTYQPDRDTRIVLSTAFMQASAEKFSSDAVYTAQQFEDSVPDYSGSLLAMQQIDPDWSVSIGYYLVDDMLWLRQTLNNNHRSVEPLRRLDVRLARRVSFADAHGELVLVVQNAGDDYQDYGRNQLFGTRSFVSLQIEF